MPTSKLPHTFAPIPYRLHSLSRVKPGIYCNLRFGQRAMRDMQYGLGLHGDDAYMHLLVEKFLRQLPPKSKVLMHFQGYDAVKQGTGIFTIDSVFWTNEPYPRLDFKHPPLMQEIHGCPNFWGAFIMAIAVAPDTTKEFVKEDVGGQVFWEMAVELGLGDTPLSNQYVAQETDEKGLFRVITGAGEMVTKPANLEISSIVAEFLNNLPRDMQVADVLETLQLPQKELFAAT